LKVIGGVAIAAASIGVAGCGEFVRESRSPSQLVIASLEASSGAVPGAFGAVLQSDVETIVEVTIAGETVRVPTIFSDSGRVTMRFILRDQGVPGVTATPSVINEVTINRYRVAFRRADGRNTPGVDVPFPFDSAVTFTVPASGTVTAGFELVRHVAKEEAPLAALRFNRTIITTIADITFFGRDQAGNEVSATGQMGVDFGNFGDPQ
jgi:hypothetical protein